MRHLMMTLLVLLCTVFVKADVLVVDNNSGAPAQYTTINAALTAANTGDTIYIQPSGTSYGNFTINKRLIIIGGGAYPLKQNTTPTKTNGIQLDKGSDGTIIMGFYIDGSSSSYCIKAIIDSLKNILIANCHIFNYSITTGKGISSWIIEGCVFSGYAQCIEVGSCSNLLFQNNIISGSGAGGGSGRMVFKSISVSNVFIKNNIWISKGSSSFIENSSGNLSTLVIENNIFFLTSFDFSQMAGCQWHNNCFYLTNTWIGNSGSNTGNIQNNPQYVNYPATGDYFNYSHDYHLATGSACIGTGTGGTNMGVYGGSMRFNPGIQPPIPQIISIKLKNSAVPVGGKLYFDAIIEKQK